jgi:hypothetical protein
MGLAFLAMLLVVGVLVGVGALYWSTTRKASNDFRARWGGSDGRELGDD